MYLASRLVPQATRLLRLPHPRHLALYSQPRSAPKSTRRGNTHPIRAEKPVRPSRKPTRSRPRREPPRTQILPDIGLTPRQLAALAGASEARILRCARDLDEASVTENDRLPPALVELVAEELSLPLKLLPQSMKLMRGGGGGKKIRRMPVVTVMGHVDHGKTSLLDALRDSDVALREVGGITQSVAAFQVPIQEGVDGEDGLFATFIDTPGHAAFKAMRANGTIATDIVVLVVAADDGVMPQSIEAGLLARAANVPVVVAINKCDTPGADADHVRYQLVERLGINTEQLGGDVQCVDISAKTRANLPQLLEAISLQAELLDLRSDPSAPGEGICLESRVDRALGSVATVLVRSGTLRPGDFVLFQSSSALLGELFGRVRGLVDRKGNRLTEAGPGVAVGIVGVRSPIPPGAEFCVEKSEKVARGRSEQIIARNVEALGTIELANSLCAELDARKGEAEQGAVNADENDEEAMEAVDENEVVRSVAVFVKGDVRGSADAVSQCISALGSAKYPVRVIGAGVGDVTETDLRIVAAPQKVKGNRDVGMIIAFNVRVREAEKRQARRAGVEILSHNLIYHLEDEVRSKLQKMEEEDTTVENCVGKAAVVRVFDDGKIGGCSVEDGELTKGDLARVWRIPDGKSGSNERNMVFSGKVDSIKHFAKSVRSVKKGSECGIGLEGWSEFVAGDVVECVQPDKQAQAA